MASRHGALPAHMAPWKSVRSFVFDFQVLLVKTRKHKYLENCHSQACKYLNFEIPMQLLLRTGKNFMDGSRGQRRGIWYQAEDATSHLAADRFW